MRIKTSCFGSLKQFDLDIAGGPLMRKHVGRGDHLGQDYHDGKTANEDFCKKHADLTEKLGVQGKIENMTVISLGWTAITREKHVKAKSDFIIQFSYN